MSVFWEYWAYWWHLNHNKAFLSVACSTFYEFWPQRDIALGDDESRYVPQGKLQGTECSLFTSHPNWVSQTVVLLALTDGSWAVMTFIFQSELKTWRDKLCPNWLCTNKLCTQFCEKKSYTVILTAAPCCMIQCDCKGIMRICQCTFPCLFFDNTLVDLNDI